MVRKIDVKAGTVFGTCAVQRGGNWNNGARAGVFSMNLNNAPSNSNTNIGFRCPPNFSGENPVIQSLDAGAKADLWRENFGVGLPNRRKERRRKIL
jgi:hypothetical protein